MADLFGITLLLLALPFAICIDILVLLPVCLLWGSPFGVTRELVDALVLVVQRLADREESR